MHSADSLFEHEYEYTYATLHGANFRNWKTVPSQRFVGENYEMQKSREGHKLVLCVHIKTVYWQGRETRPARPFEVRRLAYGALYEELLCQKPEHVACVVPNEVQFHIKFSFSPKYSFTRKSSFLICWRLQLDKQWRCQCLPMYYILMLTVPYYAFKMEW